jgi:phage terminase large subunit
MQIDFNPDLFNNVYWHLRKAFRNARIRYIWLYGGSSASKTYSLVQLIIVRMLAYNGEATMILRKYAVDIKDSIFQDFKSIISEWKLEDYFTVQVNFIKCNHTGAYVRFRGLDDSEKVKGLSGFNRVVMEEISQFDEADFKQIRKRLRGKPNQQIIGIFNPISEEHWIKKNVFDKEALQEIPNQNISGMWVNSVGNLIVLKTNYLDNRYIVGPNFVDQHTIDDFEKDKADDNAYYQIYGLGNWGKIRTGGEFWKDFKYERNTTTIGWNEWLPVFQSWDENVNPYLTCLVWQIYTPDSVAQLLKEGKPVDARVAGIKKKLAVQIDEICLEDPNNRVRNVCEEFMRRYPPLRVRGLTIGGDRTSIKEDTKLEKGENFFTKVMEPLMPYRPQLRMQSSNPSVADSGGFINQCYAGRTELDILINTRCKRSIHDYQYALEDSDRGLKKSKKTHPVTKVQYEEFGHPSDAKRYFITVNFSGEYSEYLKGGRHTMPKVGKNISKNSW